MATLFINENTIRAKISQNTEDIQALAYLREVVPSIHQNRKGDEIAVSSKFISEMFTAFNKDINAAPPRIKEIYEKNTSIEDRLDRLRNVGSYYDPEHFLMKHQQMGRAIAKEFDKFGFFYSVRAGKTPLLLQIINDNPDIKWLIVCPLVLIDNAWLEDANKFFPGMKIVKLHAATRAKRMKAFQEKANVYIINTESFCAYEKEVRALGITGVALDESSSLKNPSSKFSKAFVKFCQEMKKVYLLSGTPAPNGMHEYYTQMRCLDWHIVPQSFTQFERGFFNNISYNPQFKQLVIRPDMEPVLKHLLSLISIYVDASDYFEFPGRDFTSINIPMPDEVKKHYKQMVNDMYVEFSEDEQITAPSAAAKLNKLRQISSGFIYNEEGVPTLIDMFKFNKLMDVLYELGNEQVLIWANYKYEFEIIKQLLGDKCRIVNGTVNIQEKNESIRLFKQGKIQYLVANPASADKGLTLTNAHLCVYFSIGYSYELYHQSVARIYGGKHSQPKFCHYYIFTVEGSLDSKIYQSVLQKGDTVMQILDYIRVRGGI